MYVNRTDGKITTVCPGFVEGMAEEEIADSDTELLVFLNPPTSVYKDLFPVDFKLGMLRLNITPDMVDAAVAALPEPDQTVASIYWSSANMFKRDNTLIDQIAGAFGKTPEEVNDVWLQMQPDT